MKRRHFVTALLASLTTAGCGLFGSKPKARLPGERISVLGLDRQVAADPALSNKPVTLPAPKQRLRRPFDKWSRNARRLATCAG